MNKFCTTLIQTTNNTHAIGLMGSVAGIVWFLLKNPTKTTSFLITDNDVTIEDDKENIYKLTEYPVETITNGIFNGLLFSMMTRYVANNVPNFFKPVISAILIGSVFNNMRKFYKKL